MLTVDEVRHVAMLARLGLTDEEVEETFFPTERTRASVGVVLYAVAGVLGCFVAVPIAMVIFLALPVYYGVTSNGLYALPSAVSRM